MEETNFEIQDGGKLRAALLTVGDEGEMVLAISTPNMQPNRGDGIPMNFGWTLYRHTMTGWSVLSDREDRALGKACLLYLRKLEGEKHGNEWN